MDEAISRALDGRVQTCGSPPAIFRRWSRQTGNDHDEVLTLFHEFGHGLHHLLTREDYIGVSGLWGRMA
jgi:oligopeptidase A